VLDAAVTEFLEEEHKDNIVFEDETEWASRVAGIHVRDLPGEEDTLEEAYTSLKAEAVLRARELTSRQDPQTSSTFKSEVNKRIRRPYRRKMWALRRYMDRLRREETEERDRSEAVDDLHELLSSSEANELR
jgi:cytochrome P450